MEQWSSGDLEKLSSIENLRESRSGLGGDDADEQEAKGETAYTGMSTPMPFARTLGRRRDRDRAQKNFTFLYFGVRHQKVETSVITAVKAMRGVE